MEHEVRRLLSLYGGSNSLDRYADDSSTSCAGAERFRHHAFALRHRAALEAPLGLRLDPARLA